LAALLVTLGLLSSTFHLGHPERAWRAFSQWRSSWLSREGVAAVATYLPAGSCSLRSCCPAAFCGDRQGRFWRWAPC
jgi:DMSO reductase anchor subunit